MTGPAAGALAGLGIALGLVSVISAFVAPARAAPSSRRLRARWRVLTAQAGLAWLSPAAFVAVTVAAAAVTFVLMAGVSRSAYIGVSFALLAAGAPVTAVRARARARRLQMREVWPDLVDDLASSIRAGRSLPEAVAALGETGPPAARGPFQAFGADYRATGRFAECLDRLKDDLADPVADRVVEALRLARDVGGTDLGRLLRTLSEFLRQDARARGELESRQSWTVNAARLAVAAPWAVLALLSTRPAAVEAYDRPAGAAVLGAVAAVCVVAYRLMTTLGHLPEDARVLS